MRDRERPPEVARGSGAELRRLVYAALFFVACVLVVAGLFAVGAYH